MPHVATVVITFHPQGDFPARLDRLAVQSEHLIIVDNHSTPAVREQLQQYVHHDPSHRTLIALSENQGVASALNIGLQRAEQLRCAWALTMDQDTLAEPDLVEKLAELASMEEPGHVAVIGANYMDSTGRAYVAPSSDNAWFIARTAITSGSLVNLQAWRDVRGCREDLFIDSVDHDFCFRARAAGWRIIQSRLPLMRHQLGGTTRRVRLPWLQPAVADYPPVRRYYMTRNRVAMFKSHWRHEFVWVSRELLMIGVDALLVTLFETDRRRKLAAMVKGFWHGLRGMMGPCKVL
jgi:rhamnosyltransferase